MESKLTFEVALKKLETLVKELETGDMELENAVKKYNEGIELAKYCHELLQNAQSVVVKLMKDDEAVDFPVKED